MNHGWIKIHRTMLDWEWLDEPITMWVFFKCLLLANHEEKRWKGVIVEKGTFITSYASLSSKKAKVSVQQVRTSLERLKSTGEITIKTTNKYTIVTLCNWNNYQSDNTQDNKQITNKQQTNNKQITTTKNDKNDKNVRNNTEGVAQKIIDVFNEKFHASYQLTNGRKIKISNRLATFTQEQIMCAIDAMSKMPFYQGQNDRKWKANPDFILRSDEQIDNFLARHKEKNEKPTPTQPSLALLVEQAHKKL